MPIYYRIAADEGLVLTAIHDRATLADLRAYAASTLRDPAWSADLVEVVDARALTEPDAAAAVFDAARFVAQVVPKPRVRARAIVAPTATLFRLAERYRRDTVPTGLPIRVFRDVKAAVEWARRLAARPRRVAPVLGWQGGR